MTVTTQKFTFEQYLSYEDGTDVQYELVDGELVPISLGTGKHGNVIWFLGKQFDELIASTERSWVSRSSVIGVQSPRGRAWETSRIPDIVVLPLAQWEAMASREAVIRMNEPPPLLVVEVVSPSTKSDDYRSKRGEYGFLEIPEYWIVDPLVEKVTVCVVENQFYDATEFIGDDPIQSTVFPELNLNTDQIMRGNL